MQNQNENLISALRYYELGFSVIPVTFQSKVPLVNWREYQSKRATKTQIEQWFRTPEVNVGVVTGAISGIVIVDIDTKENIGRPLYPTATTRTGSGGAHYIYKHPRVPVKTIAGLLPGVDVRGDGGYAVFPFSTHPNGNKYEWVIPPEDGIAELPEWVLEELSKTASHKGEKVYEGTRNSAAAQAAGSLLGGAVKGELSNLAWETMKKWNEEQCVPPLPEKELRATFESIFRRESSKRASENPHAYAIQPIPLSELLAMEFASPKWLVDGLIPHEAVSIISGAPASYKTFITLDIALKVSRGEKLFGEFETSKCPVLIVDEENSPRLLQTRIKLLSHSTDYPVYVASRGGFQLGEDNVEKLIQTAKNKNIGLIIFDSFICIHGADENSASDMRNVMKHLKEFAKNGIAVIVIHHHRKKKEDRNAAQDLRGSSDILAQVDCHLAIDRKSNSASVTIHQSKLREAQEMEPFTVTLHSDGNNGYFEYAGKAKAGQGKRGEFKNLIQTALASVTEPPNRTQLWEMVHQTGAAGGEATFKTALAEMLKDGELFSKKGAKNSTLYALAPFVVQDG
jgi:hypothetical protein